MIRIEAPSRVHFGLLSLPGTAQPQMGMRHFGGAGLMIEQPGIALTMTPSAEWSAQGPCAARALSVATTIAAGFDSTQAFAINIERCPPEHVGLGTGTQLSLAVARAIAIATGHAQLSALDLAKLVGRGRRSAIGIHGFEKGGFLVEAGKRDPSAISPLVAHLPFPQEWSVLLVIPRQLQGDHGQRETEAFRQLAQMPTDPSRTDSLCRLVLLGMLPALVERDLDAFGEAVYEFNRQVGEMYRSVQGGIYTLPRTADIVALLRQNGVRGAGQSSWGPCVFGLTDTQRAAFVADLVRKRLAASEEEVNVTAAFGPH